MEALEQLARLGERFHGVSLEFRRSGTPWPAPWRATLHASKNERGEYRAEVFSDSPKAAIDSLIILVKGIDGEL